MLNRWFGVVFCICLLLGCIRDKGTEPLNGQVQIDKWEFFGLEGKRIWRLVLADPHLYACADKDGLWRKNLQFSGSNWEYIGLADTSYGSTNIIRDVIVHPQNKKWILVAFIPVPSSEPNVFRTLDGGETWVSADTAFEYYPGVPKSYTEIERFLQCPDKLLGAGRRGIFYTSDFGEHWYKTENSPRIYVHSFVKNPNHNNSVWVGGRTIGLIPEYRYVLSFSEDSGLIWQQVNVSNNIGNISSLSSIAFTYNHPNMVFVTISGELFKTTDGGQTWNLIDLKDFEAKRILSDSDESNHFWLLGADSTQKIIETWDNGGTWQEIDVSIPIETIITEMIWEKNEKVLYFGTHNGIYVIKP